MLYTFQGTAQTIINAERLNADDSLVFALSFMYSGTYGNSNTNNFDISPVFSRTGIKNDIKLFGGYNILSSESNAILNNGFLHARHNFKITKRLKTFEFYQIQFNEVLLLNKREAFGLGLRYSIVADSSVSFDMGLGAMRENEFLNPNTLPMNENLDTRYIRGTIVGNFEWSIKDAVKINNVFYYQPYLADVADFRFLNDFNLGVDLFKNLSILVNTCFDDS